MGDPGGRWFSRGEAARARIGTPPGVGTRRSLELARSTCCLILLRAGGMMLLPLANLRKFRRSSLLPAGEQVFSLKSESISFLRSASSQPLFLLKTILTAKNFTDLCSALQVFLLTSKGLQRIAHACSVPVTCTHCSEALNNSRPSPPAVT